MGPSLAKLIRRSPRRLPMGGKPAVVMVAACPFPAHRGTPIRIEQMGEALGLAGFDVHTVAYHLGNDRPLPPMTMHRTPRLRFYDNFAAGPTYTKLLLMDPLLTLEIIRVVRATGARVVHAHHFEGAICALAARTVVGGFSVVYDAATTLEGELLDYAFPAPRLLKKIAMDLLDPGIPRLCDHTITVSEALRSFLLSRHIPDEKITVIPMEVNTGDFLEVDPAEARQRLGLPATPVLVYTGNLALFQGVETLIAAMPRVLEAHPDAKLFIVGRPTKSAQQAIESRGLTQRIEIVGEREFPEVRDWLSASDLVVLPRNHCIGFPLKLLNYMAAGKPIVAFRDSGREVLRHLENAFVASDSSTEALADGMIECLRNPQLSERMGHEARRTAASFSMDAMVERVRQLYRELLPEIVQP